MRVVFMGTPEFSVGALAALAREHDVVGVYAQPDRPVGRGLELQAPPVKLAALRLGIPVFQPSRVTASDELRSLRPDVIVVVAYGQLLKADVLSLPPMGCINIHASLLPRWRGAAPIQYALLEGDSETGITTMQMDAGLDTGDMLMVARTPISDTDTAQTLHDRLALMGADLILKTLAGLSTGAVTRQPQPTAGVTHASKLTKAMEWLDPSKPALALDRQRRALFPWPGTRIRLHDGQTLKIKEAKLAAEVKATPGEIFDRIGRVYLGTADGALELIRVQWDGKREVTIAEFLNGLQGRGLSLPLRWVSASL